MQLRELLESLRCGELTLEEGENFLESWGFIQLGHQRFDTSRQRRTATPEVVFGMGKSTAQISEIVAWFEERDLPLLVTKVDPGRGEGLVERFPSLRYDPVSQLLSRGRSAAAPEGRVAVISAGSSDLPVAEEAAGTLEFFGVDVVRAYDCGVAGLHRLFASGEQLSACDVAIVVAGMDGALPSVVGGIFRAPVIAVPTSVGYGAAFEGLAALLAMLNSCAAGVTVVNIDNGFGAAVAARAVLELVTRGSAVRSTRKLQTKTEEVT